MTTVTPEELRRSLAAWATEHPDTARASAEEQQLRHEFVTRFPLDTLEALPLERYTIGRGDQENFCYWLERKTDKLGSIFGGSARKFGVYWSKGKQKYMVNQMFKRSEKARASILAAIRAGAERVQQGDYAGADEATARMGESRYTMRIKPLTLYFPDRLLPINNPEHLQHFLRRFEQEPSGGPLTMNRQLLEFLQGVPEAGNCDPLGLMRFLYATYSPKTGAVVGEGGGLDPDVAYLLNVAEHTRNIVLYGPPGTGKTHQARAFAQAWLAPEEAVQVTDEGAQAATWWQAIALALNAMGGGSVQEIEAHAIVRRFVASKSNSNVRPTIAAHLVLHTHPDDPSSRANPEKRRRPYLFTHAGAPESGNAVRWTLSEEGTAYVEQLATGDTPMTEPPQTLHFVTFHPSFAYEEFVQGLRPRASGGFEVRDGVFKRLCDTAHANPDENFVLIIDEINRADTAKTFGELLTLLEDGKRARPGERGEYEITLPYADADDEPFSVPDNIHVVGTMNTADRSITLMDVALRRRFTFVAVPPRPDLLSGTVTVHGAELSPARLLTVLNERITEELDADHQIGHAYLMGETLTAADLAFRWRHKIVPLLEEYFYAREDSLRRLLGESLYQAASGTTPLDDDKLVHALVEFTKP